MRFVLAGFISAAVLQMLTGLNISNWRWWVLMACFAVAIVGFEWNGERAALKRL